MYSSLGMGPVQIVAFLLAIVTIWISYKGFKDRVFQRRYCFDIDGILISKQYDRLLVSGFLHVNWLHAGFNMLVLYMFAESMDVIFYASPAYLSIAFFLLIYFGSMLGGDVLALYLHRNHGDYTSVGASGAVNGLIFAAITLMPSMQIWFIPGVVFGLIYLVYTMYGIKSHDSRIGHEAHLGGAISGILLAILIRPSVVLTHPVVVAVLLVPTVIFLYLVFTRPAFLLIPTSYSLRRTRYPKRSSKPNFNINAPRQKETVSASKGKVMPLNPPHKKKYLSKEEELNKLLEKVQAVGYEKLSKQEQKRLQELSQEID